MVLDDGCGVSDDIELGEAGLGSVIIKQLAQQFGGVPVYENGTSGGLQVRVPLPNLEGAGEPATS